MPAKRKTEIRNNRPDHRPGIRQEYERHKKRILATETICGICGQPVDKSLKYPAPGSPTIDHIIPISRGGHPYALENLQLAHFRCNRLKFNQMTTDEQLQNQSEKEQNRKGGSVMSDVSRPRIGLPWSIDWASYRYDPAEHKSNSDELWQKAEQVRRTGFTISIEGITPNH